MSSNKMLIILPNIYTAISISLGTFSILLTSQDKLWAAALAILSASVFDLLDGRTARFFHVESEFGAQFDSLADMISFGVAPAIMVARVVMGWNEILGFLLALFYVICAGLRLARFNASAGSISKSEFVGLPSPAAAILCVSSVVCVANWAAGVGLNSAFIVSVSVIAVLSALLMVSRVKYFSFKMLNIAQICFLIVALLLISIVVFLTELFMGLAIVFFIYALSGVLGWFSRISRSVGELNTAR